jgi:lipopolysaccharide transport protein LptA
MKPAVFLLLTALCTPVCAQTDATPLYAIEADHIRTIDGVTEYQGNARVTVSNLVIEADSISIAQLGGIPVKIEAAGDPLKFYETVPKQNINGTAKTVVFLVPELKLTLTDYVITDPGGNAMKGKKASFVLAP